MTARQIQAKSILTKSGIQGIAYCVNPYVGCSHGCVYCYATFMKRFTGHREPWGKFLDVKINAAALLARQIKRAHQGTILLSSVTDCYQPAEAKYRVTRACLEVLADSPFPVDILTKSPLVLRDMDLLKRFRRLDVGFTVTTGDEAVRRIFEPGAPSIKARIEALKTLHDNGISTYAFIGPILPLEPEELADWIRPHVESVLIDRMNYPSKTVAIYRRRMLGRWLSGPFLAEIVERLKKALAPVPVECC
ncbi:MAG: radical SAM protein [Syntrophorhabdales bacterium]